MFRQEISPEAMLFVGGHCEDDVKQGGIGNCWFVASVACFALHEKLVKKVGNLRDNIKLRLLKFEVRASHFLAGV